MTKDKIRPRFGGLRRLLRRPKIPGRILALVLALSLAIMAGVAQATVWTDKPDYSPGQVVTIHGDNSDGAGYLEGETVDVAVVGPNSYTASCQGLPTQTGHGPVT
jgi:hypothetical protein